MNSSLLKLGQQDPKIKKLVELYGDDLYEINYTDNYCILFSNLARSIAGQQLSGKAATTIWGRVEKMLGRDVTPIKCINVDDELFRQAGLSGQKTKYIKNLSVAVIDDVVQLDKMKDLSNEEIINQLTKVKGIGRWTAEMFLIFSLGRTDVFSFGDCGLKNAITKIYGGELSRTKQEEIVESWKPYRTYACLLLWKSLDNAPM